MIGIIDVHCHILPEIDDGAKNLEESKRMLEIAYAEGVRTIIATPHYRRRMFRYSTEEIEEQYNKLQEVAAEVGDGLRLLLGCEYHVDLDIIERLNSGECYRLAGTRYVLAEFSSIANYSFVRERIHALVSNGYTPVIAHVERCVVLQVNQIKELVELGALIQLNADSILGKNGYKTKRFCQKMMKEDLLDFVGTDAHGITERPPRIAKCAAYIEKKMGRDYAQRIFIDNPSEMLKMDE